MMVNPISIKTYLNSLPGCSKKNKYTSSSPRTIEALDPAAIPINVCTHAKGSADRVFKGLDPLLYSLMLLFSLVLKVLFEQPHTSGESLILYPGSKTVLKRKRWATFLNSSSLGRQRTLLQCSGGTVLHAVRPLDYFVCKSENTQNRHVLWDPHLHSVVIISIENTQD